MKFRYLLQIPTILILMSLFVLPSLAQGSSQAPASLKLSTEMVSLNVTVTDQKDRAVVGLKPEDFKVYENKIGQPLSFFSTGDVPVSWGLVLDRSDSMKEVIQDVYQAAVRVVNEGVEKDETFIVTFNNKVELVADFASDKQQLQKSVLGLRAEGSTALWDAVSFALEKLKQAKHRKKVLLVITDGEDNRSRTAFKNLIKQAEEAGVMIYTVGLFQSKEKSRPGVRNYGPRSRVSPREELTQLAAITGASATFPTTLKECLEKLQQIANEVGHQYSVGYYPGDPQNDGKWRKLKVVVNQSNAKYVARTRIGYYAPKSE
ncbi:MAG: VWA domain-containing protein [Acidobacteria bacterium]|nr:VWA domain-containing protein [Acidobacteriota bacterium]